MPYARPTLTDVVVRMSDDVDGRIDGADSRLRRSVLGVLVRTFGGALFGLYGLLDWVWRQIFPDTAEAEQLARWAAIWGVRRKAAIAATGNVTLTGVNGSILPAGSELVRADAVSYVTAADATIAGGIATVAVTAVDAGTLANADVGVRLSLANAVIGINANALVAAGGLIGGAAEEDDDALRARLLDRIQRPPHGGNANDYVAWALEVPEVTRAWVSPNEIGLGTVTLRFVMDGREDIIPEPADIDAVEAYVDELRPVTAALTVVAPVPVTIDFAINADPPGAAVEAAIIAQLTDLFSRESEPGGTILISHVREAISLAAGEIDHEVISPIGNIVMSTGEMAVMGEVEFV